MKGRLLALSRRYPATLIALGLIALNAFIGWRVTSGIGERVTKIEQGAPCLANPEGTACRQNITNAIGRCAADRVCRRAFLALAAPRPTSGGGGRSAGKPPASSPGGGHRAAPPSPPHQPQPGPDHRKPRPPEGPRGPREPPPPACDLEAHTGVQDACLNLPPLGPLGPLPAP